MKINEKRRIVRKVVIVFILTNLFLFLSKWIPTLLFPSVSVEADAFNSLGDFAYSLLFLVGFEILLRPKDESHPHGHERFEPFISPMVAAAIGGTGILIVNRAVRSIFSPIYSFTSYFLVVLLISVGAKSGLSLFLQKKGEETNSTALISSAKDAKVDVIASLTALAGVLGAWSGFLFLDTVLGLVVSIWIFKTAYSIAKKNIGFLTGASAPQETVSRIKKILDDKSEVISYHNLEAHYVGPEIDVSVSVRLPNHKEFEEVHAIEEKLMKELSSIKDVDSVYIHLEPHETGENNRKGSAPAGI